MNLLPRRSMFDVDSFFENFFPPTAKASESSFFAPRIDLKEKKKQYVITAELPGVKKEDVNVTLENGILTIEAESREEDSEEQDGIVIRQERRYGKFVRSFSVGNDVKEEDIKAKFDNGILTLKVPKTQEQEKAKRRISIG